MSSSSTLSAPLTVLLGDLPGLGRLALSTLLRADAGVQIVANTVGSDDLIAETRRLRPDLVIVAEQSMVALQRLAQYHRGPVLLYAAGCAQPPMLREAAQWGIYGHIQPLPPASHPDHGFARREVLRQVYQARSIRAMVARKVGIGRGSLATTPRGVVVIGGSTGGAAAAEHIVRDLNPETRSAIIIAVHLPAPFTASLVERIRRATVLPVVEGKRGEQLEAGKIIVVPGGKNMVVRAGTGHRLFVDFVANPASLDEPNIDILMSSAARAAGRSVLGIVLTGLGHDGTQGAHAIRQCGGTVVAQDEHSSAVFGMPKSVIQAGQASAILPLAELAPYINGFAATFRAWLPASLSSPVTRSYTR